MKKISLDSVSEREARIHAHVCGDGGLYTAFVRRSSKDLIAHPRKQTDLEFMIKK